MPAGDLEVFVTTELTARLHKMRSEAKTLLGPRYQAHMRMLGEVLKRIAEREHIDLETAALRECIVRDLHGRAMIFMISAAAELLEPSKQPKPEKQI